MRGPTFSLNLLCQRSVFDNLACVIFLVSMAIAQLGMGRSIKIAAARLNDFCQHTSASSSFSPPFLVFLDLFSPRFSPFTFLCPLISLPLSLSRSLFPYLASSVASRQRAGVLTSTSNTRVSLPVCLLRVFREIPSTYAHSQIHAQSLTNK